MVPLVRIGLTTPPLPRVCSTTEPQRHKVLYFYPIFLHLSSLFSQSVRKSYINDREPIQNESCWGVPVRGRWTVTVPDILCYIALEKCLMLFDFSKRKKWCRHTDLNRGPTDYKSVALPLSYVGTNRTEIFIPYSFPKCKIFFYFLCFF